MGLRPTVRGEGHLNMTHMRSGGDAQEYARLQVHDFDMQKEMHATLLM